MPDGDANPAAGDGHDQHASDDRDLNLDFNREAAEAQAEAGRQSDDNDDHPDYYYQGDYDDHDEHDADDHHDNHDDHDDHPH